MVKLSGKLSFIKELAARRTLLLARALVAREERVSRRIAPRS